MPKTQDGPKEEKRLRKRAKKRFTRCVRALTPLSQSRSSLFLFFPFFPFPLRFQGLEPDVRWISSTFVFLPSASAQEDEEEEDEEEEEKFLIFQLPLLSPPVFASGMRYGIFLHLSFLFFFPVATSTRDGKRKWYYWILFPVFFLGGSRGKSILGRHTEPGHHLLPHQRKKPSKNSLTSKP